MLAEGIFSKIRGYFDAALDLLLPPHCCGCGRALERLWWCEECYLGLSRIRAPRCEVCSFPFDGEVGGGAMACPNCRGGVFYFEFVVAVFRSRGRVRELVHELKYGRRSWASRPLGLMASEGLGDERMVAYGPQVIVPVPLHFLRERDRGFNQSELIAREVGRAAGLPVVGLLERVRATTTQTQFDRRERKRNLQGAMRVRQSRGMKGRRILLVDDVLTTGATLNECARVLVEAGYPRPAGLTVARG